MSFVPQRHIFISPGDKKQGGAALRKTINSHVQRESQRKRKLVRLRNITPSFWTPPGVGTVIETPQSFKAEDQSSPQDSPNGTPCSSTDTVGGDSQAVWGLQTPSPPDALIAYQDADHPRSGVGQRNNCDDPENRRNNATPPQAWGTSARSPPNQLSTSILLGTGIMDGFARSSIPLTKHMKYLLHHLLTITLPEYWTNRAAADNLRPLYLSLSASQPEALFGHLATAATHLGIKYGQSHGLSESHLVRRKLRAEQMSYKREAIRLFNKKLTCPEAAFDKSTFHVLMSLFVVESMAQDETGIRAHLNGFQKLVALRGGMNTIPEYLKMGITTLTYDWAIVTGSMPLEPPPIIEPLVLSQEVSEILCGSRLNLQDLGLGFRQQHIMSILDPRLYESLRELREAMSFREFCAITDPSLDPAQRRYFMYESMHSRYKILSLPFLEPYGQDDGLFYQSEACRLALVFSGIIHRYLDSSSIIYKSLTTQLLATLKGSDLSLLWHPATDLLAWILYIGAHISKGQADEFWFHVHLARCGLALGWREWADCKGLVMKFFYTDRLHECSFQSIWMEVAKVMDSV